MGRWWFRKPGNLVTRLVLEATSRVGLRTGACQSRERLYRGRNCFSHVFGPDGLNSTWSLKVLTLKPVFSENGGPNYSPRTGEWDPKGAHCAWLIRSSRSPPHTTPREGLLQSYNPPLPQCALSVSKGFHLHEGSHHSKGAGAWKRKHRERGRSAVVQPRVQMCRHGVCSQRWPMCRWLHTEADQPTHTGKSISLLKSFQTLKPIPHRVI